MKRFILFLPLLFLYGCDDQNKIDKQNKLNKYIALYEKKHGKEEAELKRAEMEYIAMYDEQKESDGVGNNLLLGMAVGAAAAPHINNYSTSNCALYSCSKR